MSQQLVLIPLTAMLCLGASFPLITWLGEIRQEGKGGSAGLGERVRWRFSRIWQAVDSWTAGSSFSSQWGWNFSPWKSRVINDWGSQNNLSVWFLSRPLLIFPVPVPSPRSQPGSDGLWYDSKCDYVKIFYSKHGRMVKIPSAALVLCRISRAHSCSGHSVVHVVGIIPWPQQQCSSWSEVSHPAVVFSVAKGFWGSEKCWRDSCVAALVQLMWVTTGWSKGPAIGLGHDCVFTVTLLPLPQSVELWHEHTSRF